MDIRKEWNAKDGERSVFKSGMVWWKGISSNQITS